MKTRRHHNNKGYRQIKNGRCYQQVRQIARKLNIPYERSRNEIEKSDHVKTPES